MKNSKWKSIRQALKFMWDMDKWLLIHNITTSLVGSATPFIGIFLSARVLDGLAAGEAVPKLIVTALAAIGIVFLLTVLNAYIEKLNHIHTEMSGKKFDTLMSIKTITMDYPLLDSPAANDIRARIMHDNQWGSGFYSLVWQLPWVLGSLISAILSVIFLVPLFFETHVLTDVTATIMFLLFAAVIVFQLLFSSVQKKKYYTLLDDPALDKSYFSYYLWRNQDYHCGKDVRIYNAKPLVKSKLDGDVVTKKIWMNKLICNNMQTGFWGNFTAGILQVSSYIFVVIWGAAGILGIGSVVKYAGIIYQFSQSIANVFSSLEEYGVSANRQMSTLEYLKLGNVLTRGSLPVEKRAFCDGGDNDYEIEFCDVSFKYPGSDAYVLRHINLKFHVGERMAVVGRNGSGKTTFIKLLCRLYEPTEGRILLNGIDIRKYDYEEYLRIFSVVFQDFKLFSFSLGQNVAADVDYDRERVEECLEKAGFGDRLAGFAEGTETCLYQDFDENGVELSGGEAQKIALARALYKDAPFMVLDEPTAALDPIAEAEIYSRFNEIVGNKTAIYISHRLSSCRFCDEIAVFNQGQIVQRGNHDSLVADTTGEYYALWNAQAQYYG